MNAEMRRFVILLKDDLLRNVLRSSCMHFGLLLCRLVTYIVCGQ